MRLVLFLVVLAMGSVSADAKSSHKSFIEIWSGRLAGYDAEFSEAETDAKMKAAKALASVSAASPTLSDDLQGAILASERVSRAASRFNTLKDFIDFIQKKPSPEVAQAWLLGRLEKVKGETKLAEREGVSLSAMRAGASGVTVSDLISAHEMAAMKHGKINGEIDELALIGQEAGPYFSATSREKQNNKARWAGVFSAFGNSLSQQSYQAQRGWMATCRRFGNVTHCSGN